MFKWWDSTIDTIAIHEFSSVIRKKHFGCSPMIKNVFAKGWFYRALRGCASLHTIYIHFVNRSWITRIYWNPNLLLGRGYPYPRYQRLQPSILLQQRGVPFNRQDFVARHYTSSIRYKISHTYLYDYILVVTRPVIFNRNPRIGFLGAEVAEFDDHREPLVKWTVPHRLLVLISIRLDRPQNL